MKLQSRRYDPIEKNEDFWKSFTDLLATSCLVFFFIALVLIITTIRAYSSLEAEKEEYKRLYTEVALEKNRLQAMQTDLYNIAETRRALYDTIEQRLKPVLGSKVKHENGKIEINTEVWFETGKADLTPEGMEDARKVGEAFFALLDDFEKEPGMLKISFVEVRGHTDDAGDGEYNRLLSVERATSFINVILPKGTTQEKVYGKYFKAAGMSKFNPAPSGGKVGTQSPEQQRINRRIEIYIQMNDEDIQAAISDLLRLNLE